jgi:hypothetical protein
MRDCTRSVAAAMLCCTSLHRVRGRDRNGLNVVARSLFNGDRVKCNMILIVVFAVTIWVYSEKKTQLIHVKRLLEVPVGARKIGSVIFRVHFESGKLSHEKKKIRGKLGPVA